MSQQNMVVDASLISSAARNSVLRLPDEIIYSILFHLPAEQAVRLGATCRRCHLLIDAPLLWRYYSDTDFTYWKHGDDTDPLVMKGDPRAQWREHYRKRISRDRHSRHLFESLLSTQHERYAKMQEIADSEYEAHEMLLANCNAPHDCEDVLARRYFAEATLALIHRSHALKTWQKLNNENLTTLEEQISAFDLFVIGNRWGTTQQIIGSLDRIASDIRREVPGLNENDMINRCRAVIQALRNQRLLGMHDSGPVNAMRNNYMSFSLNASAHSTRPLQSAVIFCAVARRLGITAHTCEYPGHVFIVVTIDPTNTSPSTPFHEKYLYFDPWSGPEPIAFDILARQLRAFGVSDRELPLYLSPAPIRNMVLRTCRNIMDSYQDWRRGILSDTEDGSDTIHNLDAFYSFLWCMALVEDSSDGRDAIPAAIWDRPHITHLPQYFREHYPEDLRLGQRYLAPLFAQHPQRNAFHATMAEMLAHDMQRRPVVRRINAPDVKFRVGQMLRHKRYGYVGVVRRWDANCKAADSWIVEMGVERLPKGRFQPFYDVLAEDRSQRYVAEENIEAITEDPPPELLRVAGRYFKRWDAERKVFISNVRDEYPDD